MNIALYKLSNLPKFLVAIILLPSLSMASVYSNEQIIDTINSDPVLLQKAKSFVLSNFPEVVQSLKQLPMFLSEGADDGPKPKKAPQMIGKARGTISRNLRPLNPPIDTNQDSDSDTDDTISITPGRKFTKQKVWNTWLDAYYFDVNDHRYDLNLDGQESLITFGLDRLIQENVALGMLLSYQHSHSTNFGGNWLVNSNAITIGPYLAYQISPKWALNLSIAYSNQSNKLNIGAINGKYTAQSGSIEVDVAGQYNYNLANIRYKSSFYYSCIHNNAYQMNGTYAKGNINIPVASDNFGIGLVSMLMEINRDFRLSPFKVFEPFAEIGATYQYLRPNNGQILTGNLLLVTPSPWSGLVRLGARMQIYQSLYSEANVAYLSIGQPGLNIWQGRLYLSYSL